MLFKQTFFSLNSQECIGQLNMRQLLSVGMDGPNVNFKLLDLLQREYAELNGGAQVLVVGSCGLHTLHNAMKAGFTVWQIEKFLRALHFLFHNVPARREDYTNTTGSTCFPLSFCGHRWVENVPVAERALEVWPMVQAYVSAAEEKKVQKPNTASYDTILAAREDPLLVPKLQFFLSIARGFNPFLHKYQTDEPVLPFLAKDLTELLLVSINIVWWIHMNLNLYWWNGLVTIWLLPSLEFTSAIHQKGAPTGPNPLATH